MKSKRKIQQAHGFAQNSIELLLPFETLSTPRIQEHQKYHCASQFTVQILSTLVLFDF